MTQIEWHLEARKLSELKKHPKNPRTLSSDQALHLQTSLEKFGLIDKPILNLDNTIIGGHQRIAVLKKTGVKACDCYVPDRLLTEREVDELNIRLNRNIGEWDWECLGNEWEVPDLVEWGFNLDELQLSLGDEEKTNEEDDHEQLEPESDENAKTKYGDIYELNQHRIVCGDSTMNGFVDLCLNGNKPILMVTDPPYGVNYDPHKKDNILKGEKRKNDGIVLNDNNHDWTSSYALFPGNVLYIWHASFFISKVQESLELCDFEVISSIIWVKPRFALSRGDYHWQHEPCWYMVKRGKSHNWQGARDQSTIWNISNLNCFGKSKEDGEERTAHSTQKPIECMARPIRNNSAKGEGVYDPFLGSGTTLIAAESLDRICYGLEISPGYCDIIVNRWVKHMKKNNKEYTVKKNGETIEV